jgi:hypothetical protein
LFHCSRWTYKQKILNRIKENERMSLSQSVFFQEKERKSFQRCNKPKTFIHCKQANKTRRKEKKRDILHVRPEMRVAINHRYVRFKLYMTLSIRNQQFVDDFDESSRQKTSRLVNWFNVSFCSVLSGNFPNKNQDS